MKKESLKEIVRRVVRESTLSTEYVDFFNAATDPNTTVDIKKFENMIQKIFNSKDMPPDVELFIKDHRKDPNGGNKFTKYMQQRSNGNYWFPKQSNTKTDAEMRDSLSNRKK